jgi:hypothetical protein
MLPAIFITNRVVFFVGRGQVSRGSGLISGRGSAARAGRLEEAMIQNSFRKNNARQAEQKETVAAIRPWTKVKGQDIRGGVVGLLGQGQSSPVPSWG